ncbi:MAG: flagellar biosynthesis protein FliQ [Sedimentisphaerales bacterium]|nr:flagellar biosynthesis protein FliQ [Sedimentisphaerales bacterium]
MDQQMALDLGREVLMLALKISFPLLCVGLVIGVTVSIFQAVTQIQEMTLTFVPKIVGVMIAAGFFMPWIMEQLMAFARQMFSPMVIP